MRPTEPIVVDPGHWRHRVQTLVSKGYGWLDFLTAVDRRTEIDVIARLVDPVNVAGVLLVTTVPSDCAVLDSVAAVLPGANWYEREAAEMFGIDFLGHPDPRPLLTRAGDGRPLLRKSTPLPARVDTAWPGAEAETSRRRTQPPGVLDTWEQR